MNTASLAHSHFLNKKADVKSASGLFPDLEIKGWVRHKMLMPGNWGLVPPLSPHRVRGLGDRRLTLDSSSPTAVGLGCEGLLHG